MIEENAYLPFCIIRTYISNQSEGHEILFFPIPNKNHPNIYISLCVYRDAWRDEGEARSIGNLLMHTYTHYVRDIGLSPFLLRGNICTDTRTQKEKLYIV